MERAAYHEYSKFIFKENIYKETEGDVWRQWRNRFQRSIMVLS